MVVTPAFSAWIVFSTDEFESRASGVEGEAWSNMILDRMASRVLVAIGTSMSDLDVKLLLKKAESFGDGVRPAGFVIDADIPPKMKRKLAASNLVPVSLNDHDELPGYLLSICQAAAKL